MRTPFEVAREGKDKVVNTAHEISVNKGVRLFSAAGLSAAVLVGIWKWLEVPQHPGAETTVIANGAAAEVAALGLSALANKTGASRRGWQTRAVVATAGAGIGMGIGALIEHRAGVNPFPNEALETTVREVATVVAPAVGGAACGSLLVVKPEQHA